MKIKVCGLRVPENIEAVLQLPVDYAGFIFYRKSPRYAGNAALAEWIENNEAKFGQVKRVGVFVNAEVEDILNRVHDYQLDFVQLHGHESPEYCREILSFWEARTLRRARLIKAFSVDESFDFRQTYPYSGLCSLFLFDTKASEAPGGTGRPFDWSLLGRYQGTTPFLLAGGIGPDSAVALQGFSHPQLHGIDLNSRFEKAPGVKDVGLLSGFLEEMGGG